MRISSALLRRVLFALLLTVLAGLAFLAGYLLHWHQTQIAFPVLMEAYGILNDYGLDPAPAAPALEYGMVRGMLEAYQDPYAVFLEPPQNELEGNRLSGRYGGIGADIDQDPDGYWLIYPYPEGPAAKAGLQNGDRLLQADDLAIGPESKEEMVQAALRGQVDQSIQLQVGRPPDWTPIPFTVIFNEFSLPSVTWRLVEAEPRLGLIKVKLITADTAEEVQEAVKQLSQHGVTHFALDLRDNPGGLLDAGVNLARLFLKDGVVMEQQYRGRAVQIQRVEKVGALAEIPMVALINQNSASAAEIAAGALQAQNRAILIGEPSFGKNTIQLVFELKDGSSIHVTSAHWWIPGLDYEMEEVGILPDIQVDPAGGQSGDDPFIQAAILEFFGPAQ